MCGRYALPIEPKDLPAEFGKQNLPVDKEADSELSTSHRYNIGPMQYAPVYYLYRSKYSNGEAVENPSEQHILRYMKWSMIPHWVKSKEELKKNIPTFNARYERIGKNRLWQTAVNQRCVIPIKGYFEWTQKPQNGAKIKQPYYIKRKDDKLMFLAGLYSRSIIDGKEVFSYTIITYDAPKCLQWLHERMPLVLDPEKDEFWEWLGNGEKKKWDDVKGLLKIYSEKEGTLEWYKVDREVGNTRNEDKKFVRKLKEGNIWKIVTNKPGPKSERSEVKVEEEVESVKPEDKYEQGDGIKVDPEKVKAEIKPTVKVKVEKRQATLDESPRKRQRQRK
ncbi:DEKNAAC103451 [Brettanomyces naardenensis]|uniref:DEKNAAC103451 n=1 Tax=Brettanomyces naardenensis TaxID=13370 RepID=A0A448YMY4_BRENA|nr:DEKNAAC103451 [Brettanomyces naardenensis]